MSFLSQIKSGIVEENDFELIYGVPKIGKTTFACARDGVILEDIENGSRHLNVDRLPAAKNFEDVMAHIKELSTTKHKFKTYVVDSLDHLEPLVTESALSEFGKGQWKVVSDGAFGKGGEAVRFKWQQFIQAIKELRTKMNIILIAHSQLRTINDPMKSAPYDKHDLKLQEKTAALFRESVDAILFCTKEILLKDTKSGKAQIASHDAPTHVILSQGRASHEAGNRYGIPYRIALDYEAYREAREKAQPGNPEQIKEMILLSAEDLKDQPLKAKVLENTEKAGQDIKKLTAILNKLTVVLANAA